MARQHEPRHVTRSERGKEIGFASLVVISQARFGAECREVIAHVLDKGQVRIPAYGPEADKPAYHLDTGRSVGCHELISRRVCHRIGGAQGSVNPREIKMRRCELAATVTTVSIYGMLDAPVACDDQRAFTFRRAHIAGEHSQR